MRRRRVPWPGSAASRSVSRCLPLRARDSLPVRPLSSGGHSFNQSITNICWAPISKMKKTKEDFIFECFDH